MSRSIKISAFIRGKEELHGHGYLDHSVDVLGCAKLFMTSYVIWISLVINPSAFYSSFLLLSKSRSTRWRRCGLSAHIFDRNQQLWQQSRRHQYKVEAR